MPTAGQTHCISLPLEGGFPWSEESDLGERSAAAGHLHAAPVSAPQGNLC